MNISGLFHRELGLPFEALDCVNKLTGREWVPQYTKHALRACLDDRYGLIKPGARLRFTKQEIVELELTAGEVTKIVVRQKLDERRDIIYVLLSPQCGAMTVKTVWSNLRTDHHTTLKESLYQRPERILQ